MTRLPQNGTVRSRNGRGALPLWAGRPLSRDNISGFPWQTPVPAQASLGGCWRHGEAELWDSDPPSLGYVRCFQVTYWMVLHGTRKPSLSFWHVAAPDVALSEAKSQGSSEPSIFKRFRAWSSARGSKWKCIHEEQTARFSSCCCLSAVPGYI